MRSLAALLLVGCHNMSPPPLMMRHQGAQPDAPGDTRIQLIVGFNAGVLSVDPGIGVALQLSHQTSDRWKAGGNLGVGFNARDIGLSEPNPNQHPLWLLALRGFGRYHFASADKVATEGGLGLGLTSNDTVYVTADAGGAFGGRARSDEGAGTLHGYLAPSLAVSVPVVTGRPILERPIALHPDAVAPGANPAAKRVHPRTTWFFALTAGVLHELPDGDQAYGYSLELHQFVAWDRRDASYNLGLSTAPSILLSQ